MVSPKFRHLRFRYFNNTYNCGQAFKRMKNLMSPTNFILYLPHTIVKKIKRM